MTNILTPAQLEHANGLLGTWLGDRTVCRLGEATRAVEAADRHDQALHGKVTLRLVSALLGARGFHKGGTSGHGYDREPWYQKAAIAAQPTLDDMILTAMAARPHGMHTYVVRNIIAQEYGQRELRTDAVRQRLISLEKTGKVTSKRWGPGCSIEWSLAR